MFIYINYYIYEFNKKKHDDCAKESKRCRLIANLYDATKGLFFMFSGKLFQMEQHERNLSCSTKLMFQIGYQRSRIA